MSEVVETIRGAGRLIVPEIVLIAASCILFLCAAFAPSRGTRDPRSRASALWPMFSLGAVLLASVIWLLGTRPIPAPASSPFLNDGLASFAKGTGFFGAIVLILLHWQAGGRYIAEYFACLLTLLAGVNFVATANDLTTLFLALELVSIPTYVLIYLSRDDFYGKEATLKYFLLSVFSSAFVLYGMSFLYGATGATNLVVIQDALRNHAGEHMPALVLVAIVLIVAGIGFRITAVPFHFYAPDVFAGTSTPMAALLAYVPKLAGFVVLVRLVSFTVPGSDATGATHIVGQHATSFLIALALLTMTIGNLLALLQENVKRLLAYSSVAHAGYMLVALAAGLPLGSSSTSGPQAILFYLVAYGAMTLGAFGVILCLKRGGESVELTGDLAGLGKTNPLIAFMMAVFMFSLTGLPPTAGFWGKLYIFFAAWSTGTWSFRIVALVMAVNAAVGAWYYLRIVWLMYLEEPAANVSQERPLPTMAGMAICTFLTLGLFLTPNWLWQSLVAIGP
jgi:NADH-quinone oxidoreductase subunit N